MLLQDARMVFAVVADLGQTPHSERTRDYVYNMSVSGGNDQVKKAVQALLLPGDLSYGRCSPLS